MELLKDYDCEILYHLGKANKVADALGWKSTQVIAHMMVKEWTLLEETRDFDFRFDMSSLSSVITTLKIEPEIVKGSRPCNKQILKFQEFGKKP